MFFTVFSFYQVTSWSSVKKNGKHHKVTWSECDSTNSSYRSCTLTFQLNDASVFFLPTDVGGGIPEWDASIFKIISIIISIEKRMLRVLCVYSHVITCRRFTASIFMSGPFVFHYPHWLRHYHRWQDSIVFDKNWITCNQNVCLIYRIRNIFIMFIYQLYNK